MDTKRAIFSGGCFWCTQKDFDQVSGVLSTVVGYTGGTTENPSYEEVCQGNTGHVEALEITYDPQKIGFDELLQIYFHGIDPSDAEGQFCDRGPQYRPVIFYVDDHQKELALGIIERLNQSKKVSPIGVEVLPAASFFPAEENHQEFYKKNPLHYERYRSGSGRSKRLKQIWDN